MTLRSMTGILTGIFLFGHLVCVPAAAACGYHKSRETGKDWSLEKKFFHKAHTLLAQKDEIGLTQDQFNKIKDLKHATKKDLIRRTAEIEIAALDVKSKLWQDPIDVKAVSQEIDRKYDLKKAKSKMLVEAFAQLNTILKPEQKDKLKSLRGSW